MNRKSLIITIALFPLAAGAAWAQVPQPDRPDGLHSIRGKLFPPELVMRHQKEIGLDEEQKDAIRDEIRQAELRFLDLKWQAQDAAESLREIVGKERVDQEAALEVLERVLKTENEIKRTQFALMVRIKNLLTPGQQAQLQELRPERMRAPRPSRGRF